jgi:hypothetical protein
MLADADNRLPRAPGLGGVTTGYSQKSAGHREDLGQVHSYVVEWSDKIGLRKAADARWC